MAATIRGGSVSLAFSDNTLRGGSLEEHHSLTTEVVAVMCESGVLQLSSLLGSDDGDDIDTIEQTQV